MREPSLALGAFVSLLATGLLLVAGSGYRADSTLPTIDSEDRDPQRPAQIQPDAWRRMLASVETGRYAFRTHGTGDGPTSYAADNREQEIRISFTENGVRVRPAGSREAPWEWTLQLEQFGYEGELETVAPAAPAIAGNRVEYRRGALTEWYLNDPRGLQQGFTVAAAPSRRQAEEPSGVVDEDAPPPLVIEMRAVGLQTRQEVAGASILLSRNDRGEILRYHGLLAWDAEGDPVRARMWATGEGIRIAVHDAGASYPLTIDPFVERTIRRASDAQASDQFGHSVSISGDTAIVGARLEDGGAGDPLTGAGAAYVFERDQGGDGNWGEVKKLTASDAQGGDAFGFFVSISGDTAVVGAPAKGVGPTAGAGAAYVFERHQGGADNWGEVKKLTASDAQANDRFGRSVSISGDSAIVGARLEGGGTGSPLPGAGAAYVFERNQGGAGNWGEVKKLTASDAQTNDLFGTSVSISGDTAIVGADLEDDGGVDAGAAYVFERNQGGAGNWGQVKKLTASDAQAMDQFGRSTAISGDTAIVGANFEDDGGGDAGAAYLFERDLGGAGNWGEVKKLAASDAQAGDLFGSAVSISAGTAIVGAGAEDGGPGSPLLDAGAAYLFERDLGGAGNWGEVNKLTASDDQADDQFGFSVSISGGTAIAGANLEDGGAGNPLPDAGAAYVFDWTAWAFVLDGFGGLHATGAGVVPINPAPPYFGFDVARDAELAGNGAHVLDGFGGVHPAGGEPALIPGPPYFGFDVAEDLELAVGGAYALDAFGGVHALAGAPVLSPATPYFGFDVARDLELGGGGYYVLDGFGGLHTGANATPISTSPPYFGFDIAKDLELTGGGGAYALDGFGGVHAFGGAPVLIPATPYFGFDVARDLELAPAGSGHYVLDGFGGLHAGGGATPVSPAPPYFGFDIARDLEIR